MDTRLEHQECAPLARPIPAGAVGPGTQPAETDGAALDYLAVPGAMRTYRQPLLPEPEDAAACAAGLATLQALHRLLAGHRAGTPPQVLDLADLPAADRRLVEDSLGEGEVSILRRAADASMPLDDGGATDQDAQETRLAGVWRVRGAGRDVLEVADVSGFVQGDSFAAAVSHVELPDALPAGVMNAPGVLAELLDQVQARTGGDRLPAHVINLTLLPQSEQDLAWLGEQLGRGPVSVLSRGYGNCRITATGLRGVWWVQYFNADDTLILNTLEITDVPAVALAAQEDIDDSAERLHEILFALTDAA
ncbi:MAG: hydrogenase expression/formation protein [Thiohalocapsa sp.]|uniref:hydrogenase expression/formation protein n=1 Tax=Thiohalocapsa sp. TaxID=2497641 RepID=UPI0025D034BE|nr:hydrogenase expression/formation protein [Thiohalocapsa sp.]MCG6941941.1 hydrogenase expression/formation protein [Thiohalocapsa sp.]